MSTAHSTAMRRHWQDPKYRAKMAARIRADEGVTAEIVRLRNTGMTWKEVGARVHMTETSARHRYERGRLAAFEADNATLQRQNAELAQTLAIYEERIAALRTAWSGNGLLRNHPAVRALLGEG